MAGPIRSNLATDQEDDIGSVIPIPIRETEARLVDEANKVPSRREFEREQRRRQRMTKVGIALLIMALAGSYLFTAQVASDQGASAARAEILEGAIESLRKSNEQRAAVGLPPVQVPAPNSSTTDTDAIIDNVTSAVLAKISADPRFRGPAGTSIQGPEGKQGFQGNKGDKGDPCSPSNPECRGPEGKKGQQGIQGPAGNDAPTVLDAGPVVSDGGCVFRTTLSDGTTFDKPTRAENCPG